MGGKLQRRYFGGDETFSRRVFGQN